MVEFKGRGFIWGYIFIILPLNLLSHVINMPILEWVSKPLLMPFLIAFVIYNSTKFSSASNFLIAALFFSWLGDLALLFDSIYSSMFIAGLVAFLIAHILYILLFRKSSDSLSLFKGTNSVGLLILLVYTGFLLGFLNPNLKELQIPVFVYAFVLMLMGVFAISRDIAAGKTMVIIGAILFILSDSILAFNKFSYPIEGGRFSTMITYAFAQLFIVIGILKGLNAKTN